MGFAFEGIIRLDKISPAGKIGHGVALAGQEDGRDSCAHAICCDQWDDKNRAVVLAMMDRFLIGVRGWGLMVTFRGVNRRICFIMSLA